MTEYVVIDGSPCNPLIAPYVAIVCHDAGATPNSVYRGEDAAQILHAHGKRTQGELYAELPAGTANPPGRSTHELRSDGRAFPSYRVGARLPDWCQGFDVNDDKIAAVIQQAAWHHWHLFQPYPGTTEFHHLCFARRPRATPHTIGRIIRLRATLPHR